jgi:hypothetical protein
MMMKDQFTYYCPDCRRVITGNEIRPVTRVEREYGGRYWNDVEIIECRCQKCDATVRRATSFDPIPAQEGMR